jgi:2-oxoacid:acceptor oxidoreductase delta subunit (pyruvate/2-ketoisovalerate family)
MRPVSKSASSQNNKTGSWRVFKPETDYNTCIGCSLCAKFCPDACINMEMINNKLKPVTDYDYCKGCGLCAKECPVKAIKMIKDF